MRIEKKLKELGLELPPAPPKGGVYKSIVIVDKMCYVSGHVPVNSDGSIILGKIGSDLTMEEGYAAARQVGLTILSTLKAQLGDLDKLKRVVKTLGMVNCTLDFTQQPEVINGYSELMAAVMGEDGIGARSAVGMILPRGAAVEIEVIFELH